jgi:hypothetical protein
MDNQTLAYLIKGGGSLLSYFIEARPITVSETKEIIIEKGEQPPEKPIEAVKSPEKPAVAVGVSTEETINYQKREISKELLLMEKHLQQRCKINGTACDCCSPPGTRIYSNPGPALIDSPPDHVITHLGHIKAVTQTFERDYAGELVELKVGYTHFPLQLTPEHPVLVARNVRKVQRDLWRKTGISEDTLQWVTAGKLTDHDFMVFPRIKKIHDRPDISSEMAELLGWFVAEGSVYGNRVTFSMNKNESVNIVRVKELLSHIYGVAAKEYLKPTLLHLCYTSKVGINIFKEFGHGAHHKALPDWMLYLPFDKQRAFLKGAIDGDGHRAKYSIVYTTVSETLIYQLRLILFRLGILHSLGTRTIADNVYQGRLIKSNGPRYDIIIAGDAARTLGMDGGKRTVGNHGWVGKNYVFLPVKSNRLVPYTGKVYNIAVDGDESYLTAHGAIHNCKKHPMAIEALSQEALGMTGDEVFHEIDEWSKKVSPITTAEASSSGKYDDEYPKLAVQAREMRKKVMGTTDVMSLLEPKHQQMLKEAVDA